MKLSLRSFQLQNSRNICDGQSDAHCTDSVSFPWQCPPSIMIASLFISQPLLQRAWFILSFASLKLPPLAPFLSFLLTGFKADKWLSESNTLSCRMEKNEIKSRNWILASVGQPICHLFNIDVHYVYGLFGWLLFFDPAQPVKSVTGGRGRLIMSFWLMSLIA